MRYDEVLERINRAASRVTGAKSVKLIAVSKTVDAAAVRALRELGQLDFGENRVQELAKKRAILDGEGALNWHFLGRLQSNKINLLIAQRPVLWQSCESVKAALAVDKRLDYELPCLLQINAAGEASKQGFEAGELVDAWGEIVQKCRFIRPVGVMTIGAHSSDEREVGRSFELAAARFADLTPHGAEILSMGMSGDFELAIKCGSNMVRLGTILFS